MRLSDFIESTLVEIAVGVDRARMKARDLIAINPSRLDGELLTEKGFIDFDVSVLVSETEEKTKGGEAKASAEIKVASIASVGGSIGGKAEGTSTARAEQTHRVSFKVPVYMNANYSGSSGVRGSAKGRVTCSNRIGIIMNIICTTMHELITIISSLWRSPWYVVRKSPCSTALISETTLSLLNDDFIARMLTIYQGGYPNHARYQFPLDKGVRAEMIHIMSLPGVCNAYERAVSGFRSSHGMPW